MSRRVGEPIDLWRYEREMRAAGFARIAGVDEVGRGPLAGPVIAAAVVLPDDFDLADIGDSKKLSEAARERAFARILCGALAFGVGVLDPEEIDRLNILRASQQAMRVALAALEPAAGVDAVLVDGLPVPNLHAECRALVKGDSLSASIAAASILAKVTRDRLMAGEYHARYPRYGFDRHKGYPTPDHLRALAEHGPCPLHRRSFAPVAQCALRFDEPAGITGGAEETGG